MYMNIIKICECFLNYLIVQTLMMKLYIFRPFTIKFSYSKFNFITVVIQDQKLRTIKLNFSKIILTIHI